MSRVKVVIILLVAVLFNLPINAQISFGGTPPSWGVKDMQLKSYRELKSNKIVNPFTVEQLLEEERMSTNLPERVGINLMTQLSLAEDGEWEILPSGEKICRMKIESPGALAITLYYSQFNLPEGSKLYIYNSNHTHLLGAYTSQTNPEGAAFSTEFIAGDNLIIEYVTSGSEESPQIEIEKICHGYKNLKVTSGILDCMVDVVCSEGEAWQEEKDGVVKVVTPIGNYSYMCTASLMNNTAEDYLPYIYTAFHCLEADGRDATTEELKQSKFYFNYEKESCGSDKTKKTTTLVGCRFLVGKSLGSNEGLDQALLIMNSDLPQSVTPYFNGWNIESKPSLSGVSIHHPKGVEKKISTYISSPVSATWNTSFNQGGVNAHWLVTFTKTQNGFSVTEGGSSGSPLFNQNRLVVGALTGGSSSCSSPDGSNYYAKIERFWPYISKYLDPLNSEVSYLQGKRKGEVKPMPKGLNATLTDNANSVKLSWMTLSDEPTNYIVYRNGTIVGHPATNSFVEENLYVGEHIYQVSAYYDESKQETDKSNPSSVKIRPEVAPVIDAVKRISESGVSLNWSLPQPQQTIFWGGGASPQLRKVSKFPIYLAQMWSASDLSDVEGYVVKGVNIYNVASENYTLYLKQGTNIYTQQIPKAQKAEEQYIVLEKEFAIKREEPLYCALRINSGEGYIATDNSEIVGGKGNISSFDGYEWQNIDSKGNIYLKLKITPPLSSQSNVVEVSNFDNKVVASSLPVAFEEPIQYKIYRDGVLMAVLSGQTTQYSDNAVKKGRNYIYKIEAQYPSGEKLLSSDYIYPMSDKSFDAKIGTLEVNGEQLSDNSNKEYNYSATCSNDMADIVVTPLNNGKAYINGVEKNHHSIDISAGGKYILPITIISESGENSEEYKLNIFKLPSNIVVKRWDDVLAVVNNPDNNGGMIFTDFKWNMNGERLQYTTPHISLAKGVKEEDIFSVELTTQEGVTLSSCDMSFEASGSDILLYPTLVESGGEITIVVTAPQSCLVSANISDMTGHTEPLILLHGENRVAVPHSSGTYILNVQFSNGYARSVKFIVK